MAEITLRVPLGRPLTYQEVDDNFKSVQELTLLAQSFALTAQEASTLADEAKNEAIAAKDEAWVASGSAALDAQRAEDAADRAEAIAGFDGLHNTLAGRNEPGAHDASAINYGESSLKTFLDSLYSSVDIRPALRFDFVNQGYLDPRIEFTRASKDWDSQGREYGVGEPVITGEGLWTSGARTNLLLWTKTLDSYPLTRLTRLQSEDGWASFETVLGVTPRDAYVYPNASQLTYQAGVEHTFSVDVDLNLLQDEVYFRIEFHRTAFSNQISRGVSLYKDGRITANHGVTYNLKNKGGGLFHLSVTATPEISGTRLVFFGLIGPNGYFETNQTKFRIKGLQIESGVSATPYIPTEGSQVTVAPSFQNVPKQLKGDYTVFVDFTPIAPATGSSVTGIFSIFKNSTNNIAITLFGESLRLTFYGQGTSSRSSTSFDYGRRYKAAITFREDKVWFFLNGQMILADHGLTVGLINDFDTLVLGSHILAGIATKGAAFFHAVSVFDKNLTDEQLQELTTL